MASAEERARLIESLHAMAREYESVLPGNSEIRPLRERRLRDLRAAADLLGRPVSPASPPQVLKDAKEIVSAYGYLLMRMAVVKDAQDAYDISKREFGETRETMDRLREALRDVPMQRPVKADPPLVSEDGNTTNAATRSGESMDAPVSVSTRSPDGKASKP